MMILMIGVMMIVAMILTMTDGSDVDSVCDDETVSLPFQSVSKISLVLQHDVFQSLLIFQLSTQVKVDIQTNISSTHGPLLDSPVMNPSSPSTHTPTRAHIPRILQLQVNITYTAQQLIRRD